MKVIQIGTGGWGKNHLRVLSELDVLTAICDSDGQKSREYGEKYSVNSYSSLDRLLESEEFDAAFVVTPTATHAAIVKRLLAEKKHVFVEKPMTYDSGDGREIADMAEKSGVILTCGYIERFNPALRTVKDMIRTKKYGDLIMIEFHRENRVPAHIKDVGIIYDTTVHDMDTANWLFEEMPGIVFAKSGSIRHEHEDFASIMLGYTGDRIATITANWITPNRQRKFIAACTDAVVSVDFITQEITVENGDGKETIRNERQEPLLLEIRGFLDAINGKDVQVVTPQEAVNVTKTAEAALLSSRKGIPIYLDQK